MPLLGKMICFKEMKVTPHVPNFQWLWLRGLCWLPQWALVKLFSEITNYLNWMMVSCSLYTLCVSVLLFYAKSGEILDLVWKILKIPFAETIIPIDLICVFCCRITDLGPLSLETLGLYLVLNVQKWCTHLSCLCFVVVNNFLSYS